MASPEFTLPIDITALEQEIFFPPRTAAHPGEELHNPALFPLQRRYWDLLLQGKNSDQIERIKLLLPKRAVLTPLSLHPSPTRGRRRGVD
jgi:hypothetical protein